jgi:hypothetical protein
MTEFTSRNILKGARDLVAAKWIKFTYGDGDRGYCAVGAVYASEQTLFWRARNHEEDPLLDCPAEYFLCRVIDPDSHPDDVSITRWNDAPERTHEEVLEAFDKAIELASQ